MQSCQVAPFLLAPEDKAPVICPAVLLTKKAGGIGRFLHVFRDGFDLFRSFAVEEHNRSAKRCFCKPLIIS